jgi:hypothetical protein
MSPARDGRSQRSVSEERDLFTDKMGTIRSVEDTTAHDSLAWPEAKADAFSIWNWYWLIRGLRAAGCYRSDVAPAIGTPPDSSGDQANASWGCAGQIGKTLPAEGTPSLPLLDLGEHRHP